MLFINCLDSYYEDFAIHNNIACSSRTQHQRSSPSGSASVSPGQRRVFIDTVVRNTSLSNTIIDSESDDDSDDESYDGDEVLETSSESCSTECSVAELQDELNQLEISYDDTFLEHDDGTDDILDSTSVECIDMDLSSITDTGVVECDVPVMTFEEQDTMEGNNIPATPLLPEGYETKFKSELKTELCLVKESKFVCSRSKIMELFTGCMRNDCCMPIADLEDRYCGCTIEIRWRCTAGHSGEWQSSEAVNRVYVNNLLAGASLLYSGNNFTKISLFAKCFELAFISRSTFHRHQNKYLARSVVDWWNEMQNIMFSALGNKPVVVAGDGQMDSPGFCAKNCTYTLMHASMDYVLQVDIVDVRHSQLKSVVMEKVGCERGLDALMAKINIVELVTDASSQITKMLGNFLYIIYNLQVGLKIIFTSYPFSAGQCVSGHLFSGLPDVSIIPLRGKVCLTYMYMG